MSRRVKTQRKMDSSERLALFSRRVQELANLRLVQSSTQMEFNISWDAESEILRHKSSEPNEEDLRSFLLLFRQFISPTEPIFVNRVFKDCLRLLTDERLKQEIQKAKTDWNSQTRSAMIGMQINDINLTPEFVLDLWINGYYFHNDTSKFEQLERLLQAPLPLVRMQFLSVLPGLTNIILYLGGVIAYSIENNLLKNS